MKQEESIEIANALFHEIYQLIGIQNLNQISEVAEIGKGLPSSVLDHSREDITLTRLTRYLCRYPQRSESKHFRTLGALNALNKDMDSKRG